MPANTTQPVARPGDGIHPAPAVGDPATPDREAPRVWATGAAVAGAGALLVGWSLPKDPVQLLWFPYALDTALVVLFSVLAATSAVDVLVRRNVRALPTVATGIACAVLWTAHLVMIASLSPHLPFATPQRSALIFHVAHIGTISVIAWTLLQPARPLPHARRALIRTGLAAAGAASLGCAAAVLLAPWVPDLVTGASGMTFTAFNRVLQLAALVPVVVAFALFARGRRGDPRVVSATTAALVILTFHAGGNLLLGAGYEPAWYAVWLLRPLVPVVLLAGQLRLYRQSAEAELSAAVAAEERVHEIRVLNAAARTLSVLREPETVMTTICTVAATIASPKQARERSAYFVRINGATATIAAEWADDRPPLLGRSWPVDPASPIADLLRSGSCAVVRLDDPRVPPGLRLTAAPLGPTHALLAPVLIGDAVHGVIAVTAPLEHPFERRHISALENVAGLADIALANATTHAALVQREREYAALAITDPLTGLLNRRGFEELLEGMRGVAFALIAIDVDGLKGVNDEHGHAAGDKVLRRLAVAMGAVLRGDDVLARVGGDEFAVLLQGVDLVEAVAIAERVRDAARTVDGPLGHTTLSIGCAAAGLGTDPIEAWRTADGALYHAKRSGRDRVSARPELRTLENRGLAG